MTIEFVLEQASIVLNWLLDLFNQLQNLPMPDIKTPTQLLAVIIIIFSFLFGKKRY